ncbi:MAG: preprotein translocase subunit SecE [Bacteroidales bacterium]|nr:preprotein translocase subunit SecE [Bacteroidales bacterium]MBR5778981.1 preprotein translocase subunit SecE [Bacteroidales bacterium]
MSRVTNYIKSSYEELVNKVSWPSMQELQSSAIVVAVAALIFAIIVFLMDFVFGAQNLGWKGILGYFYEIFK